MLQTETRQIGEHWYTVTQMPGRESAKMFARLTKLLGPALTEAIGKSSSLKDVMSANVGTLADAVAMFCDALSVEEFDEIVTQFAKHATVKVKTVEGKKQVDLNDMFDVVFAGRMNELMGFIGMSLQVNYSSFLADLGQSDDVPASDKSATA